MKIYNLLLFSLTIFILQTTLYASGEELAYKLKLIPGKKAIIQWERVFKSKRKLKKYGIDTLTKEEQKVLKEYLLTHAADSDHPTVAGM